MIRERVTFRRNSLHRILVANSKGKKVWLRKCLIESCEDFDEVDKNDVIDIYIPDELAGVLENATYRVS